MQTLKELLEELQTHNLPHMADGSFNITAAQHAAIISLLSQQQQREKDMKSVIEGLEAEIQRCYEALDFRQAAGN